jgi:hypothetical protein
LRHLFALLRELEVFMIRFAAVPADAIPLPIIPIDAGFWRRVPTTSSEPGHRATADLTPSSAAVVDPSLRPDSVEADRLDELSEEIATLSSQIHAATHRLLTLLAEFDRRRGWEREGHRSCAHWLSYRTGIDLGASRERVRAARALVVLPQIGAAMANGELSFSKVRALTRVATPEDEGEMLNFALGSTISTLERAVRGWKKRNRAAEKEWERALHESRSLSIFPDGEDDTAPISGTRAER